MKTALMSWVESQTGLTTRKQPSVGSQIKVAYRIKEGEKERIQNFEGTVIACHDGNESLSATFTVRKISQGHGVERTFPLHTPLIDQIIFMRQGRVRRAKLYYLRDLKGKSARLREVRR